MPKSKEKQEQEELRRLIGPAQAALIPVPSQFKFTLDEVKETHELFYKFVHYVRLMGDDKAYTRHSQLMQLAREFASKEL